MMIIVLLILSMLEPANPVQDVFQVGIEYVENGNPFTLSVKQIALHDSQGRMLWTREISAPASAFPLVDGCAMLVVHRAPEGSMIDLEFVNPSGTLVETHQVEYFQGAYVSDNMVAVLVHCANQVILFSKEGRVQATYEGKFSSAAIDATGTRVALTSPESLRIYVQSELIDETPISNPFVRDIVFSPMGTRVAVLTSSGLELWHQGDEVHFQDLSDYDASPIVLDFDSFGENILIGLRSADELKLVKVSLSDYSSSIYTQPLKSPDETIVDIITDFPGWKVHLSSGWYSFNP